MTSVDLSGVERFLRALDDMIHGYPAMKRELLEELGQDLRQRVRQNIGGTGKVQGWQSYYTGKKLGYVAVRPKAKAYIKPTEGSKEYAVGHVSNAIENGHRHRRPSPEHKKGYRYRPRYQTPAVAGKHFYAQARSQMSSMGQQELEQLAHEVASRLEGT